MMGFNRYTISIILLLCIPFQFNLNIDSCNIFMKEIIKDWKNGRELTYYENYFCSKIGNYSGLISGIVFVFIYYRFRNLKLILICGFYFYSVTWLLYFAATENKIYVFLIIRFLQGIFLGLSQVGFIVYIYHFSNSDNKCFIGSLFQFTMFLGLLFLNFIFFVASWKAVAVVFFIQAIIFGSLIWLVPDITIKPKSNSNEFIFSKKNIKPLLVQLMLMLIQQLSGIGILLGQLSRLLSGIGLNIDNYLQSCMFDFVGALSTFIAALIMDTISTRYMWCFSSFGLCIGLIIYGMTLQITLPNWTGTLGIFIYFLFYGLGEGPIPWYVCGTFFPEEVRIESSSICICSNLFLSPILELLWNNLNKNAGQLGSIIFSSVICFCAIFLGFLIPMDKSRELDSINIL